MSRRIAFPLFGNAEARYNQYQEMQKQQSYNLLVRALKSVGEERAFKLVITNIHQGDKGLEPGTLFVDGNRVFISQLDLAFPAGISMTSSVGSVTVSIS